MVLLALVRGEDDVDVGIDDDDDDEQDAAGGVDGTRVGVSEFPLLVLLFLLGFWGTSSTFTVIVFI